MTRRVAIGNFGGTFVFRVAKAGLDVFTAAINQLVISEQISPPTPWESGYVAVGAGGSATVGLSRSYNTPPFIIVRCAENYIAGPYNYYAVFIASSGQIRIYNKMTIGLTIRYCVFAP